MKPTLVILAAGMGSRYGGLKQVEPVGPSGETIMDYSVFDAVRAGFNRVVFVIRRDFEKAFRETIGAKYAGAVEVDYAFQALDDLPAGFTVPAGRTKPWGTAHAIRSARQVVEAPFAAINADDFYGQDAFARLGAFLSASRPAPKPRFAMVGYRLDQTLSEHGGVARGICRVTPEGMLAGVTEMTRLTRVADGVENQEDPARPVRLNGTERVSMNLWGFTPALFAALEERFPAWLAAHAADPKAEWYIPFVVDGMIREGAAEVEVLPTESAWFGVTYREDRPAVMAAVQARVRDGVYPDKLW
ncbi:MAG TPA: NTP transferase domain-containing protein [Kiritimatiellia bacterium]|jgi:dTDP-glucose pyrophosphorylase|nr:NTP transferase domain-containing protein [Kiritimatiellia bacterium]HOR97299.1 NTP transferase domain-containing protein [Kiritimatiellia bacterium]HPC48825.1 NTP transferase domain-containing protein [Kiritimatiellia bacterium]HPW75171.1 NTP transferase domain-containing protein [Kiritimatiellia bacterium]HRU19184.1 NTP transferase domain-containing protein [Kiritimatiellia bacterium]